MRWLLVFLLLLPATAMADDEAHLVAFTEGRYNDAASLAGDVPTPDNLAFAARSLLAQAMSAEDFMPSPQLIDQAEGLSRRALSADPEHVEARLQLAIALSLKARPMSRREAMRSGHGETSRKLSEAVLADDPDNIYAHGFMSVWHVEVRRRGGAIGASMLGASVKQGRKHYSRAAAIAPDDASVHWQYARALAALNARKYRVEIDNALAAAVACQTETTLEAVMRDRAGVLQSALETEKRSVVQRLAAEML